MNELLLNISMHILFLMTSMASLIAILPGKIPYHHNQIPRLHISTDSVYRLMARAGFDKVDTVRDSIHPVKIIYMGFTNASMSFAKKMKGYAFFSFDDRGNDTAFVWAYIANKNAKRRLERGDLEAGIDGFNKLVSSVKEEFGASSDSLLVGTVSKDILVQWKYGGYHTEVIYSVDKRYPGLGLQCHLSRWELPKPDTLSLNSKYENPKK